LRREEPQAWKGERYIRDRVHQGGSPRVEIIDWPEFEQILATKNLEIHEGGGFMKLMKKG